MAKMNLWKFCKRHEMLGDRRQRYHVDSTGLTDGQTDRETYKQINEP